MDYEGNLKGEGELKGEKKTGGDRDHQQSNVCPYHHQSYQPSRHVKA